MQKMIWFINFTKQKISEKVRLESYKHVLFYNNNLFVHLTIDCKIASEWERPFHLIHITLYKIKFSCREFFRNTYQRMKFFIKDLLNKCDQIRRKLRIWSHLLKKTLMENFIFCTV